MLAEFPNTHFSSDNASVSCHLNVGLLLRSQAETKHPSKISANIPISGIETTTPSLNGDTITEMIL